MQKNDIRTIDDALEYARLLYYDATDGLFLAADEEDDAFDALEDATKNGSASDAQLARLQRKYRLARKKRILAAERLAYRRAYMDAVKDVSHALF